jgi:hypothetical protein
MSNCINYVNYDDYDDYYNMNNELTKNTDTKYIRDNKPCIFDDKTMLYYAGLRKMKMDPVSFEELTDDNAFKFYQQWNPLTGERLDDDPYGPLYFHPDTLIKYFYTNRLNGLWVPETTTNGYTYQGYYDTCVGAGSDIYIQSRGYNPEKYLFRLPIIDCYWPIDNPNDITITYGPKLTDDEIAMINYKAPKTYIYGYKRPNLLLMKKLYDNALAKNPTISDSEIGISALSYLPEERNNVVNRRCVDLLVKMTE